MSRYLGQHFLKNKAKLRKIVDALELQDGDTIIEIGPGHGELTNEIVLKFQSLNVQKFKIIAIEKDKNLTDDLRNKIYDLGLDKNIEIINNDVLKILKSLILNLKSNYKIVGNIPYYITGYLFRILGELENKPSLIVLLIQKEVAERVVAKPPKMNLLAASVQFWAKPKIIGNVSRKNFSPPPKVDSAIITLDMLSQTQCNKNAKKYAEKYYKFIKILFKQPRKTILNNISKLQSLKVSKKELIEELRKIGVNPDNRPQDLSVEEIKKLSSL